MNIAQQYFQQQLSDDEFRHAYFEEKAKLDIEEYQRLKSIEKEIIRDDT